MNCVLGLDGGGTKTECVVLNEVGAIVARATGPPSNPTRIGFPAALAAIQETCASAIENCSQCRDRKSTRLNSSHQIISYAVFCLKKKNNQEINSPYKQNNRNRP